VSRAHQVRIEEASASPRRPRRTPAAVPFGARTPAGVLDLQRLAGNRATALLVRPARPSQAPASAAPTATVRPVVVQRGVLSFLGDVVTGAGSYAADVGRGFKRAAKGLRVWNSDALVKMHEENVSAVKLFGRLVSDPEGTVTAALTALTGGLVTYSALPASLQSKATAKFKDAAPGIVQTIIAKAVGKALAQKMFMTVANRILTSGLVRQLLKKLGASATVSKTGVGIPLAVFSSLGLLEKASAAADRLETRFPVVYQRLKSDDLHLLWFVIEPHLPEILPMVYQMIDEYIERTRPDGRVLVNAGGGNDRTPIRSGPDRTPIRTGP